MAEFITSGRLIDAILAMMVAEAIALYVHGRRFGRGLAWPDVLINLAAGASLMLAVRAALTGAGAAWIAVCLTCSLIAHCADLKRRWRRRAPQPDGVGRAAVAGSILLSRAHK